MVAPRFCDLRPRLHRLRNPRRKSPPRRRRLKRPARLPQSGALRHRLGRPRRRHGLLRHSAAIRENAQAVRQQTHRFASIGSGKTRLDDHRNRERTAPRPPRRPPQRSRQSRPHSHLDAQDEQRRHRPRNRPQVPRHPRRQRHRRRLLHHAPHEQPRVRLHLRRHQRHPQIGDRRKNHRHLRLRLTSIFSSTFFASPHPALVGAQPAAPQTPSPQHASVFSGSASAYARPCTGAAPLCPSSPSRQHDHPTGFSFFVSQPLFFTSIGHVHKSVHKKNTVIPSEARNLLFIASCPSASRGPCALRFSLPPPLPPDVSFPFAGASPKMSRHRNPIRIILQLLIALTLIATAVNAQRATTTPSAPDP